MKQMLKKIRLQPILPQNKKQNMFNHWGGGGDLTLMIYSPFDHKRNFTVNDVVFQSNLKRVFILVSTYL